jgi:small-conductance mechanosensitive channel
MPLNIFQILSVALVALLLGGNTHAAGPELTPTSQATETSSKDAGVSKKDLEDLALTLNDETKRKELLRRIEALVKVQKGTEKPAEGNSPGAALISILSEHIKNTTDQLLSMTQKLSDLPELKKWALSQFTSEQAREIWIGLLIKLGIALGVGIAIETLTRFLLARPRRAVAAWKVDSYLMRIPALGTRTLLDIIPVAIFAAAAYATLPLTEPSQKINVVALVIINAYAIARIILALLRMIFVPASETLRILPIVGETANYLFIWARRITYTGIYGYFFAEASLLLGLPPVGHAGLLRLLGLLLAGMVIILIYQNKRDVADLIEGGHDEGEPARLGNARTRLANIWHLGASLYVAVVFGVWAFGLLGGFQFLLKATITTVIIFFAARYAALAIRKGVEKGFSINDDVKLRFPTLEERANRYVPVLQKSLRIILYVAVTTMLFQTWGVDIIGLLETPTGKTIANSSLSIILTLVIALVFWEIVNSTIERFLSETDRDGNAVERSSRALTLLPLLKNIILIFLVTTVILTILSEIGVNIAPLLAGAGVIGLAVGFGAQTLVKDIITGAFILFENTISVGDVVELGSHSGKVEKITIRSIQLRDFSAHVHTIPFSSVDTVTNKTKGYSYAVFEVGVGYGENTDQVTEVLHQIGADMQEDADLSPQILEPLDVVGVDQFGDSAVVIKARLKTVPSKQWAVGREFNRRIKIEFDKLGIEIPFPHTTLYFGENKSGITPAAHVQTTSLTTPPESQQNNSFNPNATGPIRKRATTDDDGD